MKKSILTLIAIAICTVASAKDIKTLVITPNPQMHCESCENKIKNALRFEKGVKEITTSIEQQTITVKYDADKISESSIVEALAKANYTPAQPVVVESAKSEATCCKGEVKTEGKAPCCKEEAPEVGSPASCCKAKEVGTKAEGGCCKATAACQGAAKACCNDKKTCNTK